MLGLEERVVRNQLLCHEDARATLREILIVRTEGLEPTVILETSFSPSQACR